VNYDKLKTNLKVAIERLKLIEKKKTENARKATIEIAELLKINKYDRARIKVEHIIREDYMIEALEIIEMYLDLLLARFGMLQYTNELESGLEECVISILWAAPRIEAECSEMKSISEQLASKYGKKFAEECRSLKSERVNLRLLQKMNEQPPGDLLVEQYLAEIALSHKIPYNPSDKAASQSPGYFTNITHQLKIKMDTETRNSNGGKPGGSSGGSGNNGGDGGGFAAGPIQADANIFPRVSHIGFNTSVTPVSPPKKIQPPPQPQPDLNLPDIPTDNMGDSCDELSKRFENLKKH